MIDSRRTDGVLLLVAIVWGSSYLAAKSATAAVSVLVVLFGRYAVSAVAAVAVATVRDRGPRYTRAELRAGTILGLTQAAVLVVETFGVARTSAANAGLIISLTMVLTPLLDRSGGAGLPGVFFAAAGVCVVAVGLLMAGSSGLHAPRLGDVLILVAAVIRAGHVTLVGRLTGSGGIRPLNLTAVQTVVGTALFGIPVVWQVGELTGADARTWADITYLALFCSVFAFLAQTWAVQRTSASRASLLLGTEPVWAVATGIVLGGERLTVPAAVGAVLMVAGTSWGQAIERRHRAARQMMDPSDTVVGYELAEENTACLVTTPTTA